MQMRVTARKSWQFTIDTIAKPFVKASCLEIEGVHSCIAAAAISRDLFSAFKKRTAMTAAAGGVRDPKNVNLQPIPDDRAKKSADHLPSVGTKNQPDRPPVARRRVQITERRDALADNSLLLFGGILIDSGLEGGCHILRT